MRRKIVEIDEALCNGCGNCITSCAEGAIKLIAGKAKLTADKYCDGLGDCIGHCPTGALKIIERDAEAFDETVVAANHSAAPVCSCPSQRMVVQDALLNNWPIQLSLISEDAEFLANSELMIAADCTAFAHLHYHQQLLKDKVLLICCPKLDNTEPHLIKLRNIFAKHEIKSITIARMLVPCCAKLTTMVLAALQVSKQKPQLREIVINNDGESYERLIKIKAD